MYQNPPLYTPGPPVVCQPVPRRRPFIVSFLFVGLVFFCGSYAIDPDPGHVLVQHQRSVDDTGIALSMVLPDNGQVTDTPAIEQAVIRAVIGSYSTTTALAAGPDLALVHGDGRFTRVDLGTRSGTR
jgi:hypothetical protein